MLIYIRSKCLVISLCSVIVLLAGVFVYNTFNDTSITTSSKISNWGLGFKENGICPVGNVTKEYLKKYNAYYVGDSGEKIIYLTFDGGYENGFTENILDTLKKNDVKAAFFLVGHYLEEEPNLVKRMIEEGHIVANHTYNHPDMSKITQIEFFKKELNSLEAMYKEITGEEMSKYYRPPQGKFNEDNLKMANELGYKTIFWSLAYEDWYTNKQPSKELAFEKLIPRIHPGAVVLLHLTSKTNAEILDELLNKWKDMGYTFNTLDDLVKDN
ncbi:MAG: delta-lactam-biosynthetic de-N-acetylase [Sedimentibacter sp.]